MKCKHDDLSSLCTICRTDELVDLRNRVRSLERELAGTKAFINGLRNNLGAFLSEKREKL
jgi:hypothetical protein